MTRGELEEAISNLESLITNHFDPAKILEYDRQLQLCREQLRALEQAEHSARLAAASRRVATASK